MTPKINNMQFTLDLSNISNWTKNDYALLTSTIVQSMTIPQIEAMQHLDWIPLDAVTGFSALQISSINVNFRSITGNWLNHLSISAFKAVKVELFSQINSSELKNIDDDHLFALTANQVSAISDFAEFTYKQFALLNISLAFTTALKTLTTDQIYGMTLAQFLTLHNDQIHAINCWEYASTTIFGAFTPENIQAIGEDFSSFMANRLNALSVSAFQAMSPIQVSQIKSNVLSSLDLGRFPQFTEAQTSGLTASQISLLDYVQFQKLKYTNKLHLSAVTVINSEQLAAIKMNFSQFSADWFNALKVSVFSGVTLVQIQQITLLILADLDSAHLSAIIGKMNNAQLSALPAQQVAGVTTLTMLSSEQFGLLKISELPASFFSTMTKTQYAGITSIQYLTLNSDQKAAMVNPGWLPIDVTGDASLAEEDLINIIVDETFTEILSEQKNAVESLFSLSVISRILKTFSSRLTDVLTSVQYADLQSYVEATGQALRASSPIYSLLDGMVNGSNGASVYWGDTNGTRIGNLKNHSTANELNDFIGNWLDGSNRPEHSSDFMTKDAPLYSSNGPGLSDVKQGALGDCFLFAPLQAIVNANPDYINLIIQPTDNKTYCVRFFTSDSEPVWVNVDNANYESGGININAKWGSVIERAYLTYLSTYAGSRNNYSVLNSGNFDTIMQLTGMTPTIVQGVLYNDSTWNSNVYNKLKSAIQNGLLAVITSLVDTYDATDKQCFISGHMLAIIGFNSATNNFIMTNPWSSEGDSSYNGTFEASIEQLRQNGKANIAIFDTPEIN